MRGVKPLPAWMERQQRAGTAVAPVTGAMGGLQRPGFGGERRGGEEDEEDDGELEVRKSR